MQFLKQIVLQIGHHCYIHSEFTKSYGMVAMCSETLWLHIEPTVASSTKEVNPQLAKSPSVSNERLANRNLTSLLKEATGISRHDIIKIAWISLNHQHGPKLSAKCI